MWQETPKEAHGILISWGSPSTHTPRAWMLDRHSTQAGSPLQPPALWEAARRGKLCWRPGWLSSTSGRKGSALGTHRRNADPLFSHSPGCWRAPDRPGVFLSLSGGVIRAIQTVFKNEIRCSLIGRKAQQTVWGIVCSSNVDIISFVFGSSTNQQVSLYSNRLEKLNKSLCSAYLL